MKIRSYLVAALICLGLLLIIGENSMNKIFNISTIVLVCLLAACKPPPPPPDAPTLQLSEKKYVRGFLVTQVPNRKTDQKNNHIQQIYIPGVTVTLEDVNSGTITGKVITDLSGRFNFPAQEKGDYKLCWNLTGYQPNCQPKPVQVRTRPVNVGDISIKADADFEKTVIVYGRVFMRDEAFGRTLEPVVGINTHADIIATDSHGTMFYKTAVNNQGEYVIPNAPRNEEHISVTAKIEAETMTRMTYKEVLQAGSVHRLDVTLRNHVPRILDVTAKVAGKAVEIAQVGDTVELSVKAVDADADKLSYEWSVVRDEGVLSSTTDPDVSWQLPAEKGLYVATVYVRDGHGGHAVGQARLSVGVSKASFSGKVMDTGGNPINAASIEIGGTGDTATSNADGYFTLTTSLNNRYVLNIRKAGFAMTSAIYNRSFNDGFWILRQATVLIANPTQDIVAVDNVKQKDGCYIPPLERIDWKNFSNTQYVRKQDGEGRTVAISKEPFQSPYPRKLIAQRKERQCGPGVEIKIPANALQDENGNSPAGPVTIELSTVDLLAPDSMPGDYSVDDGSYMISYGASSVNITAGGVSYHKLKPGFEALLRIPVSDVQLAAGGVIPPTIPKLVYNEKTGLWEREAEFKLDASGLYYEASVKHFSTINTDIQKTGQSCVRFKSTGMPLPYNVDVIVPIPGGAPVQRTAQITANDQYNLIINLPNITDITLVAYTVVSNQVVPHGMFTVNTGGAQTGTPTAPNYSECQTKVVITPVAEPVPGPDAFLHGLYSFFATKVAENDGSVPNPALKAELEQATIDYYNTLDPRGRRNNFTKFKQANGFVANGNTTLKSAYGPGEEVRAAYANAVDLGFGRDMHGKRTLADDGQWDIAFYVTNYGDYTTNDATDHQLAVGQDPNTVVATVAMEWSRIEDGPVTDYDYYDPGNVAPDPNDPNAPLVYSDNDRVIKFYVYNKAGNPLFSANLDTRGARPIPQLCMVCHGGAYAGGFNTGTPSFSQPSDVKMGAVMLPFDIHGYAFSGAAPANFSKTNQQLEFHELNKMVVDTQPAAVIEEIIDEMYSPTNPAGADSQLEDFVVAGWSANPAHQDMYLNVIKPACRVCHASRPLEDNGGGVTRDLRMQSVQQFLLPPANGGIAASASNRVCTTREMPHALATYNRFWHSYNPISPLEGTLYQPSRLQVFFDGVVEPVLGGELGNNCVTTPAVDDSVIEEPATLTLLQNEIFGDCGGCHQGSNFGITMNLSSKNNTHSTTVGVNAQESSAAPKLKRITGNQPNQSYLFKKVSNNVSNSECNNVQAGQDCTDAMPPSSPTGLSQESRDDIEEWINAGALNN